MLAVRARAEDPVTTCTERLDLRGDGNPVVTVGEWIGALADRLALSHGLRFHAELCLVELIGNTMEHSGGDPADLRIRVEVTLEAEGIRLTIRDNAHAFDPFADRPATAPMHIGADRVGGWGIDLVRRFATRHAYRHVDGQNIVDIEIRL